MSTTLHESRRRILVIDDNEAIHRDFRKILGVAPDDTRLDEIEAEIFGSIASVPTNRSFDVDVAFQGEEGLELVRSALGSGDPYALAFVDVRMPPGWDGIETLSRIWQADPMLQAVICTAYADYSFAEIHQRLPELGRYLILKKPADPIEVSQMAHALTEKWHQHARIVEMNRRLSVEEARHRALLDALPDAILRIDGAGRCLDWRAPAGPGAARYSRSEPVRDLGDLFPPDAMPLAMDRVKAAIQGGGPELFEFSIDLGEGTRHIEGRAVRGGASEVVMVLRDVTSSRAAEEERARHREIVLRSQAEALAALSAPFIPVGEHVAVVPLVGSLKARRLARVQEVVLQGISAQQCSTIILDLTGVSELEAEEAAALVALARAAQLLGARLMLTGMHPAVAGRVVELDIDLRGIPVHQTLLRGIQAATRAASRR
jgi:anti-anti-sigma regulatory factor/ActR/RegA family two-component response regulator